MSMTVASRGKEKQLVGGCLLVVVVVRWLFCFGLLLMCYQCVTNVLPMFYQCVTNVLLLLLSALFLFSLPQTADECGGSNDHHPTSDPYGTTRVGLTESCL